jgi:hypothetical protein
MKWLGAAGKRVDKQNSIRKPFSLRRISND